MSSHRLSPPSAEMSRRILAATTALTIDQIRAALPEADRALLDGDVSVEMTHLKRPMTSGNRAALYAVVDVFPGEGDTPGMRSDTHALVSWTYHGANDLVDRPNDLMLELDRITPVTD